LGTGSLGGNGKFLWAAGSLSGTLTVANTITTVISGSDGKSLIGPSGQKAVLNLHGPTTLSAKLTTGGAQINNSGPLTLQAGASVAAGSCCVSPDKFVNTGQLTIAAGTGTAAVSALSFTTSRTG